MRAFKFWGDHSGNGHFGHLSFQCLWPNKALYVSSGRRIAPQLQGPGEGDEGVSGGGQAEHRADTVPFPTSTDCSPL